jgi:hypothetical protein
MIQTFLAARRRLCAAGLCKQDRLSFDRSVIPGAKMPPVDAATISASTTKHPAPVQDN